MDINAAGLERAKEAAGGPSGLARALDYAVTPQAISQWKQVPPGRVLAVERATGVRRWLLRADLYPAPRKRRRR